MCEYCDKIASGEMTEEEAITAANSASLADANFGVKPNLPADKSEALTFLFSASEHLPESDVFMWTLMGAMAEDVVVPVVFASYRLAWGLIPDEQADIRDAVPAAQDDLETLLGIPGLAEHIRAWAPRFYVADWSHVNAKDCTI